MLADVSTLIFATRLSEKELLMTKPLFRYDQEWSPQVLSDVTEAMEDVAINDLGLSLFLNQITVVPDIGMLDAYANNGMPHMFPHWSFGKKWKEMETQMKQGQLPLAYELIVPTDPCISWNLASNSMATMATVIAHAAMGHNAVFKNNYLFKKWTHSRVLADYCLYARDTILEFEKEHGVDAVEAVLDAALALAIPCGVFRHGEPPPFDIKVERQRLADRMRTIESHVDVEMLGSVPGLADQLRTVPQMRSNKPELPQENVLYFIERYSPRLAPWQREVVRIVRTIEQQTSFPMAQTKVVHEGAAMFVENYIMRRLHEKGLLDDATMLESARLNSGVLYQQELRRTGKLSASFNPYALGLRTCEEIVRVSGVEPEDREFFAGWIDTNGPTDEDKAWFPTWAGDRDWRARLRHAWYDYRDESFLQQFVTPRLMRDWQLFALKEDLEVDDPAYVVTDTVHERTLGSTGYAELRHKLGQAHSWDARFPDIRVTGADLLDERTLELSYFPRSSMELTDDADQVVAYATQLWGYPVTLEAADVDEE